MSDILSLLITLIICIAPFAALAVLIYFLAKGNRRPSSMSNNEEIIAYLKKQKSNGYKTIDDLIEYLQGQSVPQVSSQVSVSPQVIAEEKVVQTSMQAEESATRVKEKPTIKTSDATIQSKRETQISSAEVLLYLGSFLISFAMLVLVALGWEAIPGIGKTIIVGLTVIGFLAAGLLLVSTTKLKQVGYTFLTVGSIGTPLAFLGLWNFMLVGNVGFSFALFWTVVSILTISMNVGFMVFAKKKRFFYLLQIAIFSLFISFAFTLTNDSNFRIIIIALLNVLFYFTNNIFGQYKNETKIISRIANMILNVFIILAVSGLVDSIQTDYQRFLAIIAMLIPTSLIIFTHFKERSFIESGVELALLPLKLALVLAIVKANVDAVFISYGLLSVVYILIAEFELLKKTKILFYLTLIIAGGILGLVNLGLIINWTSVNSNTNLLNSWTILISLVVSIFGIIFIPLKRKNYTLTGIALTYTIFVFTRILNLLYPNLDLETLVYIFLGIVLIKGFVLTNAKYEGQKILEKLSQPFVELLTGITLTLSLFTINSTNVATVWLIIAGFLLVRSLVLKSVLTRFIAYLIFIPGFAALLHVFWKNNLFTFLKNEADYSLVIAGASIIFFVVNEILRHYKKTYWPELITSALTIGIAIVLSVLVKETLWINILIIFLYFVVNFALRQGKATLFANYALLQILLGLGLNILGTDLDVSILIISLVNLAIGSFTLVRYQFEGKENGEELLSYLRFLSHLNLAYVAAVCLFAGLAAFLGQVWVYTLVFFVIGLTVLTSHNRTIQKFAGIPFIFALWNMNSLASLNFQFYVIPITVYGLVLAGISYIEGKKQNGEGFEVASYSFQMLTLLGQSMFAATELENITVGIILIFVSVLLIIMGLFRSKKSIWVTAAVFLFIELFIRFFFVILIIPWWMYLGLIGFGLIALAVYIIYKNSK